MEPEILVNITFRINQLTAMDREAFAEKMEPLMREALIAGGDTLHLSLQPYDPEED